MALLDHNTESEFPFSKTEVFDAVVKAIPTIKGMKISSYDKITGRIKVKAGMSWWSWGEDIPIQLISVNESLTKIQITSSPKTGLMFGGAIDMGKNRKNLELIINATSNILSGGQSVQFYQTSKKWYDKAWLVLLLCLIFFPVGLFALWKGKSMNMFWKIVITAVIIVVLKSKFSN